MSTKRNYRVTVEMVEWPVQSRYCYTEPDSPAGDFYPAQDGVWKSVYQQSFEELDVPSVIRGLNAETKQ